MDHSLRVRLIGKLAKNAQFILRPIKNSYRRYKDVSLRRTYHEWAVHNELHCFVETELKHTPLVSVVVPVFNTPKDHLNALVYSLINQHYQEWELLLVDASTDRECREYVKACADIDKRIRIIPLQENKGISYNTNAGLEQAKGDFVAFVDHDDLLHPCALHAVIERVNSAKAELIYTDEDKVTHNGSYYFGPHCKPDWSPNLLENVNYINHLTVIKKDFVDRAGGLRPECDGAQDYDLLLRVIDESRPKIEHVSHVLYHWRAAHTSTAHDISTKSYVFKAGEKALNDHFSRRGIPASASSIDGKPGFYYVKYEHPDGFTVVVGKTAVIRQPACVKWLKDLFERRASKNIELIIGDWFEPYQKLIPDAPVRLVDSGEDVLDHAISKAAHNTLVVFNSICSFRNTKMLDELVSVAEQTGAVVQPLILSSDEYVYDAGLVSSAYGLQPLFMQVRLGFNTFFGNTDWVRNISKVSGNAFAVTKPVAKLYLADSSNVDHICWAHTICTFESDLITSNLPTFNSQLSRSFFEIGMQADNWKPEKDREDDQ